MTPAADVIAFLNGKLSLVTGTNLFEGGIRPATNGIPRNAVFITETGGNPPIRVMSQINEIHRVFVFIRVRWSDYASGVAKTEAIRQELQAASIAGYLDFSALQSRATYVGLIEQGDHIWMLGYTITFEQAA